MELAVVLVLEERGVAPRRGREFFGCFWARLGGFQLDTNDLSIDALGAHAGHDLALNLLTIDPDRETTERRAQQEVEVVNNLNRLVAVILKSLQDLGRHNQTLNHHADDLRLDRQVTAI